MSVLPFHITKKSETCRARAGVVHFVHGKVETPCFVPVATKATVKTLTCEDLLEIGVEMLMCNTYHLMLKPGSQRIAALGGLNTFMGWPGPVMTDSGGFQAFSLGLGIEHGSKKKCLYFPDASPPLQHPPKRRSGQMFATMDEEGVHFRSVYDMKKHLLTPEKSIQTQEELGADLVFVLDECTSPFSSYEYTKESMERTHRWAQRSVAARKSNQAIFGIIQGGEFEDLRKESARFIASLPVDGIGIGGSLGKSKKDMHAVLDWIMPLLPENKPRHLLGIGVVEDLFESVERGVDLFDCVSATRNARSGYVYYSSKAGGTQKNKYRFKIAHASFALDTQPLDPHCPCKVCQKYTRAYLHHLFKAEELTALRLLSYHNVYFMVHLVKDMRKAILDDKFMEMKKKWMP
ncbi:tRNA guanosine(34) transglycosylase Tgt [Candidatus Woesearchaeota archaeon]|nr:tRNA guanosine(34) transglycosylase Tgt [Candidatus Woesearchaeota archaeon]